VSGSSSLRDRLSVSSGKKVKNKPIVQASEKKIGDRLRRKLSDIKIEKEEEEKVLLEEGEVTSPLGEGEEVTLPLEEGEVVTLPLEEGEESTVITPPIDLMGKEEEKEDEDKPKTMELFVIDILTFFILVLLSYLVIIWIFNNSSLMVL
jgi:hypothetical protein